MFLYQDITQALTPFEEDAVKQLQTAALHLDCVAWNGLLQNPIIQYLLAKKILQIGTQECEP